MFILFCSLFILHECICNTGRMKSIQKWRENVFWLIPGCRRIRKWPICVQSSGPGTRAGFLARSLSSRHLSVSSSADGKTSRGRSTWHTARRPEGLQGPLPWGRPGCVGNFGWGRAAEVKRNEPVCESGSSVPGLEAGDRSRRERMCLGRRETARFGKSPLELGGISSRMHCFSSTASRFRPWLRKSQKSLTCALTTEGRARAWIMCAEHLASASHSP